MRKISAKIQTKWKPLKEVKTGWQKWLPVLLILGVMLVQIKKIFVDFNVDGEYAITMSYRLAMGDHMFSQMREPHQTSAFLLAFFIKLWMLATGTTTGIVLYLNTVSVIIKFLVTLFLYRTLKKYSDNKIAFFATIFFAALEAKSYVLLDFSNMQIYSSVLLFCFLLRHLQDHEDRKWLCLAAISLCLEVLSYPSCLITGVVSVGILLCMSQHGVKDSLVFSAICCIFGTCYILFFAIRLGWTELYYYIQEILSGDMTHSAGILEKFTGYGTEIRDLLILYGGLLLLACLAALLVRLARRKMGKTDTSFYTLWYISFFVLLGCFHFWCVITANDVFEWVETYFPAIILGGFLTRFCTAAEKRIYWLGICFGLSSLFAVLLLTNMTFDTAMAYMLLGAAASFIPIGRGLGTLFRRNAHLPLCLFCGLVILRGMCTIFPMANFNDHRILSVRNIVRSGPAVGILSDYMGPYIMNMNLQEWPDHVHQGDRVLIVGGDKVSSLTYLFEDVVICIDSTICTPTYNERLLQYWEQNPDKLPNVVVVDCWFGDLNVDEDSWIMQWVYEEFGADSYEDGTYQRYYRR